MAITVNGSGTITGVSVGGLPDGIVDTDMLAASAVTEAKLATDPQQGIAKAWVSFNGTSTLSINDSFNVSSVTDVAVGQYKVNFTNAFANTSYAVTHGAIYATGNGFFHSYYNLTASSVTLLFIQSGGTYTDSSHVSAAFFGD